MLAAAKVNNKLNKIYEFYEGEIKGKIVFIGLAFPGRSQSDENILAAEIDNRLVLNLTATVNKNHYLLGDISSVHYMLTKSENILKGQFVNGFNRTNVKLIKVSGNSMRTRLIKAFFEE